MRRDTSRPTPLRQPLLIDNARRTARLPRQDWLLAQLFTIVLQRLFIPGSMAAGRPPSGRVLFCSMQSAFYGGAMHRQLETVLQQLLQLFDRDRWCCLLDFQQCIDDMRFELACLARSWSVRQKPRQTVLFEGLKRSIKCRTRKSKTFDRVMYAAAIDLHFSQHFVLHLHQITGIEKWMLSENAHDLHLFQHMRPPLQCRSSFAAPNMPVHSDS